MVDRACRVLVAFALVLGGLTSCASTDYESLFRRHDEAVAMLNELYDSFAFDAGEEPDWETQRRLFLPGATIVPSIQPERQPVGNDVETFIADFRTYALTGEFSTTGLHERVLRMDIHSFGGVGHAFVAFEAYVPGEEAPRSRGLDSIQLIHDGSSWRVASFTTQFETDELRLP